MVHLLSMAVLMVSGSWPAEVLAKVIDPPGDAQSHPRLPVPLGTQQPNPQRAQKCQWSLRFRRKRSTASAVDVGTV